MAASGKKFADVVVAKLSGRSPAGMPPAPDKDEPDKDDEDGDDSAPGERGKIIIAANRRGDGEALEEAIRSIVEDCMKDYGGGK